MDTTLKQQTKKKIPYLWSIEDVLHREHGDDCQYLLAAAKMDRLDEHLAELGLKRELGHPASKPG